MGETLLPMTAPYPIAPTLDPTGRKGGTPKGFLSGRRVEAAGLLLCLALAAGLLAQRVASGPLPSGDEGSWLSAAASLAAGEGFVTRWLEFHYLEPYALPRPDDMRYPVLTGVLALGIKAFGPSFVVARALVAGIFLAFLAAAWWAVRLRYGGAPAFLTAFLTALSPLQLEWASAVYCEGLFGLVLALWLVWIQKTDPESRLHSAGSGALIGLLALARPNGLLLAAGLVLACARLRPPFRFRAGPALAGLMALAVVLLPWLLRNFLLFGDPFHVGGSAGLLRESHQDDATLSPAEFLTRFGPLYPLLRAFRGIPAFLDALHHFEKGLHVVPLLLAAGALLRLRPFFSPAAAWGFAASLAACLYAGYNSWAGVRYFTPFLPFVYAYGIRHGLDLFAALALRSGRAVRAATATGVLLLGAACALPVVGPHRFYLRYFAAREPASQGELRSYLAQLDAALPPGGTYLAASLGQVNYMGSRLCVGLQGPRRAEWLPRALRTFGPRLLVLTPAELAGPLGRELLPELADLGLQADPIARSGIGILFRLVPTPGQTGKAP